MVSCLVLFRHPMPWALSLALVCPRTVGADTLWRGYCAGLRRTGSLYLLVVVLQAVSAVYEALEVIYVAPLLHPR